MLIMNDVRYH